VERLNQWLTLAANFGVLAGIVFLAFEIQQNTSMMRSEIYQARSDTAISYFSSRAESGTYSVLMTRLSEHGALDDPTTYDILSVDERRQVGDWFIGEIRMYDTTLYEYEQGMLDEEFIITWRKGAATQGPKWLAFYGDMAFFRSAFVEEVKKAIAE
jgi:hypothetical protein